MTTIAVDLNEMASDSMASDEVTMSSVTKSWRVHGTLVGVAGTYSNCVQFIGWLKGKQEGDPPSMEGVCAVVLKPDGLWMYDDHINPYRLKDKFVAIGSGAQAAMAAMHLGCTPREAVRVAAKIDPSTGGRIYVKKLIS